MTNNIQVDKRERDLKQNETILICDSMSYSSLDKNDVITVSGNITLSQKNKTFKADYGYYDKKKDYYELHGNVQITAKSLSWLLTKGVSNFSNEDIKDVIVTRFN